MITALSEPNALFRLDAGDCQPLPLMLAPGQFCELLIGFGGHSQGSHASELVIESNDAASPAVVTLRGTIMQPIPVPALHFTAMMGLALLMWLIMALSRKGRPRT